MATAQDLESSKPSKPGGTFWLIFLSLCMSVFLSALDTTAVANALPVIINDLQAHEFSWVGTAYALSATAFLPMSGGAAEIFGRKPTLLVMLAIFALGSALSGAAQNMGWLIAARTVQGIGGGGILSLSSIVVSDLIPLRDRGAYNGLIGMVWAVASAVAPLVGGALAQRGQWRWIFYLNLPICGVAFALVFLFMNLPMPSGSLRSKVAKVDWLGNFLIIGSSTAIVIAITWGGIQFEWSSSRVLTPLIFGAVGLLVFFFYEFRFAHNPMVPVALLSNRTSISGYIQTFCNPVASTAYVFYLPVYFQACHQASPLRASVDMLAFTVAIGPFVIIAGISVAATKRYRPQLWIGWTVTVIAAGVHTIVMADTPVSHAVGIQILLAAGMGSVFSTTYFPVLSPLPVQQNAYALSFFSFLRAFAAIWGIAIGSAILQNQLRLKLPKAFLQQIPGGLEYAIITEIPNLPDNVRQQVSQAFGDSLSVLWKVLTGILSVGLLASFFMADVPMHSYVDEQWALQDEQSDDVKGTKAAGTLNEREPPVKSP